MILNGENSVIIAAKNSTIHLANIPKKDSMAKPYE